MHFTRPPPAPCAVGSSFARPWLVRDSEIRSSAIASGVGNGQEEEGRRRRTEDRTLCRRRGDARRLAARRTRRPAATAPVLTTQQGIPVADDQNSLKVGARGPTALEDFHFREKIFHFDHERIPERVVHARGFGAHGFFENYESLADITRADLFQRPGEKTPAFVRFSTVAGNKGSADLARDVRGFAVKLYTKEGNWDIVGNNIPVFFIQDAIKFPDLIHAAKQEPDRGFPQAQTAHDNFWDFISLTPESMHMVMWIMSDRAIPRSFRFMEGFGVHTFRLVNAEGKSTFVKFHWKPKLGLQSVVWNEAVKINGADPDFHRRDLWNAIQAGDFPGMGARPAAVRRRIRRRVRRSTCSTRPSSSPKKTCRSGIVGRLVLDRCVDNFFAETEQVAFCTQNIVPGIDFCNDPLLQGRNFSYLDTQVKRLGGPNFTHIPDQRAQVPVRTLPAGRPHGDAQSRRAASTTSRTRGARSRRPARVARDGLPIFPGRGGGPKAARCAPRPSPTTTARRGSSSSARPRSSRATSPRALTFELSKVETPAIRARMVSHLLNIDRGLAEKVAEGLRLREMPKPADAARPTRKDLKPSPALSIQLNGPESFAGRKVGALVTDGVDARSSRPGQGTEGRRRDAQTHRARGRRRRGQRRHVASTPTRSSTAARPCFSTPSRSCRQRKVRRAWRCYPRRGTSSPMRVAHQKFIAYVESALPLLDKAGVAESLDDGFVS